MGSQVKPTTIAGTRLSRRNRLSGWCARSVAETGQAHGAVKRVAGAARATRVESVRSWVKQADTFDGGEIAGVTSAEAERGEASRAGSEGVAGPARDEILRAGFDFPSRDGARPSTAMIVEFLDANRVTKLGVELGLHGVARNRSEHVLGEGQIDAGARGGKMGMVRAGSDDQGGCSTLTTASTGRARCGKRCVARRGRRP